MAGGSIGRYRKPNGEEEVRMHFPVWKLPDGREIMHVTVHSHRCGTCSGGDHTHVEINDTREAVDMLSEASVVLDPRHREALDALLIEKLAIDALTEELHAYVSEYA